MKRVTLLVEMRCNNFCVYCGARAIDPAMIESRRRSGLTIPDPPSAGPGRRFRRALRVLAHRAGIGDDPGAPVRGGTFEAFTLDRARTVLAARRAEGYEAVHFQGGEPTLWPPLAEAIAAARELGYRDISVVTNGRQLTDVAAARRLIDAGLTSMQLSLLGHDATTHDGVTLVPGSFEAILAAISACVNVRDSTARSIRVSCNLITSAETHAHLAEQVTLLQRRGVRDATIHLVRFELFGDDPEVRRRMAFPIEAIRASLASALDVAAKSKFTLQLDDVPICFHPSIAPDNVSRMLERAADGVMHDVGPFDSVVTGSPRPRAMPRACADCIFVGSCGYVPAEYVPSGAERAVIAVTPESLSRALERETPSEGALRRIEDMAASVVVLAENDLLDDASTLELLRASRKASARMLAAAIDADDELEALRALHGALGLRPPQEERATGRLAMARATNAQPANEKDPGPDRRRLELPGGGAVRFSGRAVDGGVFEVASVVFETPPDALAGGTAARSLLAVYVERSLRPARRVRFIAGAFEVDLGTGWRRIFVPIAPDSLGWRTV